MLIDIEKLCEEDPFLKKWILVAYTVLYSKYTVWQNIIADFEANVYCTFSILYCHLFFSLNLT